MRGQLLSILKMFLIGQKQKTKQTGRILPCEGVDKGYDAANRTVREIEIELEKHLESRGCTSCI